MACRSRATSTGSCSTISSGPKATNSASAWFMSITKRSGGPRRIPTTGIAESSAAAERCSDPARRNPTWVGPEGQDTGASPCWPDTNVLLLFDHGSSGKRRAFASGPSSLRSGWNGRVEKPREGSRSARRSDPTSGPKDKVPRRWALGMNLRMQASRPRSPKGSQWR